MHRLEQFGDPLDHGLGDAELPKAHHDPELLHIGLHASKALSCDLLVAAPGPHVPDVDRITPEFLQAIGQDVAIIYSDRKSVV